MLFSDSQHMGRYKIEAAGAAELVNSSTADMSLEQDS